MKIAQLGTFDVENYGDLLFPTLAEKRLRSRIPELTLDPVSPVGGAPVWKDCSSSIGYDDFSGKRQDYHGFLVGGGNIIRVNPSSLKTYNKDAIPILGYANLWAGVAAENDDKGPPICWNAPGVPSSLPSSLEPLLRACLERVDYVSVRDELSRDFLREVAPDIAISVVPDPAWEIDRLWTHKALNAAYRKAFVSREAAVPDRSVAIHVHARYLGGATIEEVAAHLDNLCRVLQGKGVLIAIGPCHGDDELARRIAECMETGPLTIDRPASLKEIAACIARSAAYVGSSMHGFITASSFCVPAVIVASPRMVKFPGLLSQIGLRDLLHQTWPEAIEHVTGLASTDHAQALRRVRADQQMRLDEHWSKITAHFQDSRKPPLHQPETVPPESLPRGRSGLRYPETLLSTKAMEMFVENQALRERERKREARVGKLEKKLRTVDEAADRRIAKLERALERAAEVERLSAELTERQREIERLSAELSEGRREAERLSAELETAQTAFSERDADVKRLGREAKTAEQALSERAAEIERLAGELSTKDKDLEKHETDLARCKDELRQIGNSLSSFVRRRVHSDKDLRNLAYRMAILPLKTLAPVLPATRKRLQRLRAGRARRRDYLTIKHSGLFDSAWYLEQYPDVAATGVDPVVHYLGHGAREGRDPNPLFDTSWYLERYRDVAAAGVNPFVHYLRFGIAEGRDQGTHELSEGRREAERLSAELTERQRETERLSDELSARVAQISDLESAFAQRADEIERLSALRPAPEGVGQPIASGCSLDLLQTARSVTVVIPVHNAYSAFIRCIASVLQHSDSKSTNVLLIDDASTDSRIQDLFDRLASLDKVVCIRNAKNLGYTRSINAGNRQSGTDDVVLLNSDTLVGPRWLDYLRIAAYSGSDVGTVTAVSDNAGAFSVPKMGTANPTPPGLTPTQYARLASQAAGAIYPEVPTGSGFCMYLRRDMLEAVGPFNEGVFPRGYGEENDLCMRSLRAGWRHLVCPRTLVYHVRSASFGDEKEGLLAAGRVEIDRRYPEYSSLVRKSFNAPPFVTARERLKKAIDEAKRSGKPPGPRIMYVLSTRGGGTAQTSRDLAAALRGYCDPLLLHSDGSVMELTDYSSDEASTLAVHRLASPLTLETHRSREYESVLADWLTIFAVELVHVRHFAWHSLGLSKVCATLNIPVVLSFHDFYALCPTVNLVTNQLQYCGAKCDSVGGDCRSVLWPNSGDLSIKGVWNAAWRDSVAQFLRHCDAFVTTSVGARQLLTDSYPEIDERFTIIPHGRDFPRFARIGTPPKPTEALRVLVPGNIGPPKGADMLKKIAALGRSRRVELHFLGKCNHTLRGVRIQHGPYSRENFVEEVEAIRPHVGVLLSIWPETYLHTLTEMWACGLPVVAIDIGAAGERIRIHGGGWLLEEATAECVLETLQRLRSDPEDYLRKVEKVARWQEEEGRRYGTAEMASRYVDVYERVKTDRSRNADLCVPSDHFGSVNSAVTGC